VAFQAIADAKNDIERELTGATTDTAYSKIVGLPNPSVLGLAHMFHDIFGARIPNQHYSLFDRWVTLAREGGIALD
jgi:hypothetical protein